MAARDDPMVKELEAQIQILVAKRSQNFLAARDSKSTTR